VGPNLTCLGEFDIAMESGLFLDSQVEWLGLWVRVTGFSVCTCRKCVPFVAYTILVAVKSLNPVQSRCTRYNIM
jgi:hypothetical protein